MKRPLILALLLAGLALGWGCGPSAKQQELARAEQARQAEEAAQKAEEARVADLLKKEQDYLVQPTWIVSQGQSQGFMDVATVLKFRPDGTMIYAFTDKPLGSWKIDPSKGPKEIDLTVNGKTRKGVYSTETGDRPAMKVCLAGEDNGPRPTKVEDPWGVKPGDGKDPSAAKVEFLVLEPIKEGK